MIPRRVTNTALYYAIFEASAMAGPALELQGILAKSSASSSSLATRSLKSDSASLRFYQRSKSSLVNTQKPCRRKASIGQAVRFEDDGYSSFYEPIRCGKKDKCKSNGKSKDAVIARATVLEAEVAEVVCGDGTNAAGGSSLSQEVRNHHKPLSRELT